MSPFEFYTEFLGRINALGIPVVDLTMAVRNENKEPLRDLDVYCEPSVALKACSEFETMLQECGIKTIIRMPPCWGHRVVAVDSRFQYYELHCLKGMYCGPFRLSKDAGVHDCLFMKRIVMTYLANNTEKANRHLAGFGERAKGLRLPDGSLPVRVFNLMKMARQLKVRLCFAPLSYFYRILKKRIDVPPPAVPLFVVADDVMGRLASMEWPPFFLKEHFLSCNLRKKEVRSIRTWLARQQLVVVSRSTYFRKKKWFKCLDSFVYELEVMNEESITEVYPKVLKSVMDLCRKKCI